MLQTYSINNVLIEKTFSPGSGKNQMYRVNVLKTRRIANARIHVERAINRLNISTNTVPLTMVPLFNDILLICASLCNLLPPLVV